MPGENITCPACKCAISADGRTLVKRSPRWDAAEQADKEIEKLEAALEKAVAKAEASRVAMPSAQPKRKAARRVARPARPAEPVRRGPEPSRAEPEDDSIFGPEE